MRQLLLGLDIGSSSIKAAVVDADTGKRLAQAQSPNEEMPMVSASLGWAEQDPDMWWQHVVKSVRACLQQLGSEAGDVSAIGISYQMHGLVVIDEKHEVLRPSIIWCDSRAVDIGRKANEALGPRYTLEHFLNSPGNFTASKLRWVRENEPDVFDRVHKFMLPGDYIAMRLSGEVGTTETGLSEGIFWDFKAQGVSDRLLAHYGFDRALLPTIVPTFGRQSVVNAEAAEVLGLQPGTVIAYRAGDQPNNALSLNVLNPGETAATAGTSGVIYSVTDKNAFDAESRVNTFLHVNHRADKPSNGVLLCVNGTGILNSWLRRNTYSSDAPPDYAVLNAMASQVAIGAEGLMFHPFGNGAERILGDRTVNAAMTGLDFNRHHQAHVFRAGQEGIVFALRYGFDILRDIGVDINVIRAGHANMFLSEVFREAFVNTIGAPLERYNTDGATGAALGAGIGAGIYASPAEAFHGLEAIGVDTPDASLAEQYEGAYIKWKQQLNKML